MNTKKQEFLTGHTNNVSCLAVSKSGRYLASGQVTHMGFKVKIQSTTYSCLLTNIHHCYLPPTKVEGR